MIPNEEPGPAGRAWRRWVPWACLAAYLAGCLFLWTDREWKPEWDGAVYLLTGQSLAAGEGYAYQGEPFFLRPPGLPWMLSFLVDEHGFDAQRVNLLIMFFAAAAVAAVFLAVRGLHDTWTALAVALLVGSSPLFVQLFNFVFAEYPFVAFTFLGIASLHRAARPGSRWWAWALAGGLCLAVAISMRTVAVLVLPGAAVVGAWRGRGRARWGGALAAVAAGVLTSPWWIWSHDVAAGAEVPVEQDLLLDYATAMFHVDPGDPTSAFVDLAGWTARIAENGGRLFHDLTRATLLVPEAAPGWIRTLGQVLVAALVVLGLVFALRRRGVSLFEWLGLAYIALLVTYFAYHPRLVMPLVPLVYLYVVTALVEGVGGLLRRRSTGAAGNPLVPPLVTGLLFAGLLSSNLVFAARRSDEGPDLGPTYRELAAWIRAKTRPDARILCNQAPIIALLAGRPAYTFRFVRSPDILTKYDIDYVLYDAMPPSPIDRLVRSRRVQHWAIPLGGGDRATIVQVK